ncbi:rhomboid family intramembrane serine protease [Sinomonas cyclohexanicum]|uniref:Rhomboid family intramembrane serine protease n=1 Tax=Sinomonas cyclohexanicum TaxID=322009 RepID=A0ABN6FB94_SINCY|nr:rhomboid family intramembrane serine protease [Corynebacterium cyclohexanicum]BCT74226.1 rhomboid family intramembrane serine protease [Corynebacterium cyclohexanicum]
MSNGSPAAGPDAVPVCPRHPDRVSYVTCQRCGRPACPECQRPAAVGFHCVDCVRELAAARQGRQPRNVYGATARPGGRPMVTFAIIGLCVLVYALQWLIPNDEVFQDFAYANSASLTAAEPWRMLTSAFLHSQGFLLHIVLNMYTLWLFGQALEPYLGRIRFLAVYLLSAVGGSVGFLLLAPGPGTAVIGASGAIFGLFGGLFVVMRQRGGDVRQLLVLIAINAVLGFVIPGIAWQAHLGGLVTGAAATAVIAYAPRGRARAAVQAGGLVAVAVVLAIATVVKVSSVPLTGGISL